MAELFDRIELTGLRRAHLDQLYSYLLHCEEEGWHVGNRELFKKRHNELKSWLCTAVEYAYSESVVMPGDRKTKPEKGAFDKKGARPGAQDLEETTKLTATR